ncbi:DUF445 domain-containing protein [Sphingomicrobium nitratireducens]|uniref:DUF445 domain-containing protein n=1 Tax=Sphingomicrobium nitratireducens TaxID=2964666 RepID=UPI00223F5121|nr:DUF445 domain-containing protein [Sphingomicrobium nitratireducens]
MIASAPPLARFSAAQPGATSMKLVATGLLVVMAALFFTARAFEPAYPVLGWLKAFTEAAMVGGLADWFAVTALFRHPLGLPIPHTAIIPKNKDRIGDALANFIRENFLIPPVVARRMHRLDLAGAAGRFLKAPAGQESRIRKGASRLIADLAESLGDERLGGIVKGAVSRRLREMAVAPLIGRALASAINEDRHLPLLEATIRWLARTLDANESMIREMVRQRVSWVLRVASLDEKLADAILEGLRKLAVEMHEDPAHPVRIKIEHALADVANDLQLDPSTQAKVEEWKMQLIENDSVALWIDAMWQQAREAVIRGARNPDAAMAGQLGEILVNAGTSLESDPRLKMAINRFARRAVVGMASSYGGSIVKLVSDTVRGWDAATVTDRLEAAVGRDLQYIRINGTLVGGLVGTALHALDVVGL